MTSPDPEDTDLWGVRARGPSGWALLDDHKGDSMNWTRDDLKWWIGIIASVVVGIATLGTTVTEYGIPLAALPFLRLIALVVGIVSGKLATSPLPGENDSNKVDSSRFMIWLLPLVLVGGLSVQGCAFLGLSKPDTIVTPAGQQAWTAKQAVDQLGRFQNAVIDAQHANKVKAADARELVAWLSGDTTTTPPTVGLMNTIAARPTDWQAQAKVTWKAFRPRLAGVAELANWLPVVDSLIGVS